MIEPIGSFKIVWQDQCIIETYFTTNDITKEDLNIIYQKTKNAKYITSGTTFQEQVWQAILQIPYGETRTYKDIAIAINKPKAYRAVANACGKNKLPMIIPCHRVVGVNHIGGYTYQYGNCKKLKQFILDYEK